ncbi:lytic murein transglycosylase [Streptomyces sp. NRRL WC-3549]|uniref:lytic transglycosylase domain-containing protein n=1 Tax=Streptomyces sp. NRRL WC-3549 TaxID=1463925 RepID=UPI0004C5BD50|nr:lytic murein transglycosylase [Streptomyces sp. NRRL WC-3549]
MAAQFGRRLRRGATGTAVAAVAVAALAASQAPAATSADASGGDQASAGADTASEDVAATGNSPYHTDLPPLVTPDKPSTSVDLPATGSAEAGMCIRDSRKVESGQARGGQVDADGTTHSPILGPALNGQGFALIKDTDGGAYDGDATHDRAVGPMQFIPSTWEDWGQDGNGDGRKDPNNIYDAALAAGRYLCAGGRNLSLAADLDRAVLSYNHSQEYLRTVRSWFDFYNRGTHQVPDGTGVLPSGKDSSGSSPSPTPKPSGSTGTPKPKPTPTPTPTPAPSKPGGGTSPSPTPEPPKPTEPTTPPATPGPPRVLGSLENAGTPALTATAGEAFAGRVSVRARDTLGAPLAQASVTFTLTGSTDARFDGDRTTVTVRTGADGTVTAPVLTAGEETGAFTVTAVAGTTHPRVLTFRAQVTAREADALTRTGDEALTAAPGTAFTPVEVKATYQGTGLAGTAVTATLVTGGDTPVENDEGPYFKGGNGQALRTLTGLRTGADGVLELPALYADDTEGTYTLLLTTESGATLTVALTVKAAPAA